MAHQEIETLLTELENSLRQHGLWHNELPEPEAFQSQQPFCIDTMEFTQWLQFIFVPRMQAIVDAQAALPATSGITPMAEEYFRAKSIDAAGVIVVLQRLDDTLSNGA